MSVAFDIASHVQGMQAVDADQQNPVDVGGLRGGGSADGRADQETKGGLFEFHVVASFWFVVGEAHAIP
jgi:hypothetical protein